MQGTPIIVVQHVGNCPACHVRFIIQSEDKKIIYWTF